MAKIWFVPGLGDAPFPSVPIEVCRRVLGLVTRQWVSERLPRSAAIATRRDAVCEVSKAEAVAAENADLAAGIHERQGWEPGFYRLDIDAADVTTRPKSVGIAPDIEMPEAL